jgi:hypothetical protein
MTPIDVRLALASGSEAALSNCSKQQPLLDHLVGAREQRRRMVKPSAGDPFVPGIRPPCSPALAWPGSTAPLAAARPVGQSVEHPRSGIARSREELVERPGDTAVQGRIGVAENDPHVASELFQLWDPLGVASNC